MAKQVTLSIPEMYALARKAGLSPADAATAAAVGESESSGRSWVTSPNPDGGVNVGPWQLDTPGGGGAGYTVAQLQDPWTNAQAMAKASKNGTDWSTWETYVDGSYQDHTSVALDAVTKEQSGGPSWIDGILHDINTTFNITKGTENLLPGGGSLLSLPSEITGFFSAAETFVNGAMWLLNPANWVRVVAMAAAVGFLAFGLSTMVKAA